MTTSGDDLKYFVALNCFAKFGPVRIKKIKKRFPSARIAFQTNASELIQAGIDEKIAREFVSARSDINPDKIMEQLQKENIKIVSLGDKSYPELLSEIYDPPPLFYYKGEIKSKDKHSLAVVGSRKSTHYGQQAVEAIVSGLVQNNLTIISGLALGIDAMAHSAALAGKGRTIAVLGTGLDKKSVYPASNCYLAEKIISLGGAVISEFPPGSPPLRHHFPQRNRIISGLALGVLIVEAEKKSGALITARLALDQNRDVFAIPGNIFSLSSTGPNNLIKQGAKLVNGADDIMEALDLKRISSYINKEKITPETKEEKIIIEHLSDEPKHIDELIRSTEFNAAAISGILTMMEIRGLVKNLGGMRYALIFN